MNKLAALKDSLAKRNILLMVVFAPSKAHFCAEYLPTRFAQKGKNTHYDYFTKACQARNIAHIDFNQHFLKLKSKSPYPLFTKTGIHWSAYGAALAMDSIFKRMEQEKKVDMPDFDWQDMELSDTPRGTDDDVMNLANMYTTFKNPTLAYPKFKFNYKLGQQKLKTLTIGDSFWWDIYRSGANENMFEKAEYWCLFKDVFPEKAPSTIAQYGIRSEMESYDVIVIEATGLNLYRFGFGFIEKAYESYLHPKAADFVSLDFEQKVAACKISMRNNPEWLYNLTQRAAESHISLDSIMQRDAIYTVKQAVK